MLIDTTEPSDWRALQNQVAAILRECGMVVEVEKQVELARGQAKLDVYAEDPHGRPKTAYVCECKRWQERVPQTVAHAFRTVVGDAGANWGLIISQSGFQSGAESAVAYSNVQLLNWREFQELFVSRWITEHFLPTVDAASKPLFDLVDNFIGRKLSNRLDSLSKAKVDQYFVVRKKWLDTSWFALHMTCPIPIKPSIDSLTLPIRGTDYAKNQSLPDDVLDAPSLRGFLNAIVTNLDTALSEFDEVLGGRLTEG